MSFSASAANKLVGNRIEEKPLRFNPQWKIRKVMKKHPPITQSQIDLIAFLRKCLDDAGVDNSFIIVPEDSYVASHVIRALIRLAKAHDVDTGRGKRSLNGT